MTTAKERAQLKEQLRNDGKVEFFYRPPPKAQYYRPDGTPLPTLLPSDAYGMQRYFAKGFTLSPPENPTPVVMPYADTVVPYESGRAPIDRPDALAIAKQERKQALHDEAMGGVEGVPVREMDSLLVIPQDATAAEAQAIYEEWSKKKWGLQQDEQEMVETVPQDATHLHKYKSNRIGSMCLVDGCEAKRQKKSHSKSKSKSERSK